MRMGMMRHAFLCAVLAMLAGAVAHAEVFSGAGSSAAAPIYRSWGSAYEQASGHTLAYASIGSSAGVQKIKAGEVGYGASDVAPAQADLDRDGLLVFPIAVTGIAPVINLPRVTENQLRLNGPVLAGIYLGTISRWNASEIAALNPRMSLPDLPIKVIVRGDGSGTTYNFADYLAKVSPAWREKMGVKSKLDWPSGFIEAKGSEGVARKLSETVGGIAYVDYGYVPEFRLTTVQLSNQAGEFVAPSHDSFRAALNASSWISTGNFTTTLTQQAGTRVWPLTMATFALVPKVSSKPQLTTAALRFLAWSFMRGDDLVQKSNFVRLPDRVQAAAFKVISSVKDEAGHPIGLNSLSF